MIELETRNKIKTLVPEISSEDDVKKFYLNDFTKLEEAIKALIPIIFIYFNV